MGALRIVYVEDNAELREMITELIAAPGRSIVALPDAESAWAACQAQPADVLITDINLPGMSGTELARRLLAVRPQQWVVFCSGYEAPQALARLGPRVRSLPKAFDCDVLDALLAEIEDALSRALPP